MVAVTLLASLTQAQAPAQRTLDDLLRQRADAVRTHNEQAFAEGVDPDASPQFADAQRQQFHNLSALPIRTWSYERDGDEVRLVYALKDEPEVTKDVRYEFVERRNRWYLRDAKPLLPWDFAPVQVRSTTSGVVLSHPGDEALADRVLAALDPAVTAVTEVWGTDWARQVVVVLPHNPDELRELVGPVLTDVAGIAVADRSDPPVGQRVVINPERAGTLPPLELGILIRHEITHVAARQVTRSTAPMWLLEGFADYVGFRASGLSLKQAAPLLTSQVTGPPKDFVGPDRDLAYQQAYSLCLWLAAERGEQGLVDFYRTHQSEVDINIDVEAWRKYLRDRIG